jgi:hypothetical protein
MSIPTKLAAFALAASVATGALASSTHQADAKPFGLGWGVGAGIVGAGDRRRQRRILDTAIAAAAGFASSSLRQLHGPRPQLQLLMIDIAD